MLNKFFNHLKCKIFCIPTVADKPLVAQQRHSLTMNLPSISFQFLALPSRVISGRVRRNTPPHSEDAQR